jgi:hypothetical protein
MRHPVLGAESLRLQDVVLPHGRHVRLVADDEQRNFALTGKVALKLKKRKKFNEI